VNEPIITSLLRAVVVPLRIEVEDACFSMDFPLTHEDAATPNKPLKC